MYDPHLRFVLFIFVNFLVSIQLVFNHLIPGYFYGGPASLHDSLIYSYIPIIVAVLSLILPLVIMLFHRNGLKNILIIVFPMSAYLFLTVLEYLGVSGG